MQQTKSNKIDKQIRHIIEKENVLNALEELKNLDPDSYQALLLVNIPEEKLIIYQNSFDTRWEIIDFLLHTLSEYYRSIVEERDKIIEDWQEG